MTFINTIRSRRKELGLSQSTLARLIGLAESNLSQLELGKREPWPKVQKDLSRVLGKPEGELFPKRGIEMVTENTGDNGKEEMHG